MNGESSDEENREKEQNGVVNGEKGEKDGEKEKEKSGEKEEADKDQEVVLIQDTGFNVKIIVPGIEDFELPVSKTVFKSCQIETFLAACCL